MALDAFKRLASGVLAQLGEDAFLRGEPCRVNIEHGVQMSAPQPRAGSSYIATDHDFVYEHSVATIAKAMNAKQGDVLNHPDGTYAIDAEVSDNGFLQRFVVRPI